MRVNLDKLKSLCIDIILRNILYITLYLIVLHI